MDVSDAQVGSRAEEPQLTIVAAITCRPMSHSKRWEYPRGLIDPPGDFDEPPSPLQLYKRGIRDPADQYWGEADGMLEISLVEVIAGGPRLQFEFEQQLPGGEDPDAEDPILEAIELRHRGQPDRARALLEGLIERDPRCLDAHAHLGGLAFDHNDPAAAQAHYATGVRTAESSLPDGFGGWGWVDNRPFLRCLHGLTWRRQQYSEAETLCRALRWLSPSDNQGARELLGEIAAGVSWPRGR